MTIDNRRADQSANQSAKYENTQDNYNTDINPVKDQDYYIPIPLSAYTEGIRALATLANITAVVVGTKSTYIDTEVLRILLGLGQKGEK